MAITIPPKVLRKIEPAVSASTTPRALRNPVQGAILAVSRRTMPRQYAAFGSAGILLRQAEREKLARVVAAADRHHDVLRAVDHISHRRAALRSGHPDGAHFL